MTSLEFISLIGEQVTREEATHLYSEYPIIAVAHLTDAQVVIVDNDQLPEPDYLPDAIFYLVATRDAVELTDVEFPDLAA